MPAGAYRFFDHTGDFGVDVTGADRAAVVEATARAFLELLTGSVEGVEQREERELVVEGLDPAFTLVKFGNELLFLFESEGFLCARFSADDVGETWIEGTAWGEPFDAARHSIARPMKAITHHEASFSETQARLIFDL